MKTRIKFFITIYLMFFLASPLTYGQQVQGFVNKQLNNSNRNVLGQEGVPSLDQSQNQNNQDAGLYPVPNGGMTPMPGAGVGLQATIRVHVLGEVLTPGILTIPASNRLSDVISLAGPKSTRARLIKIKKTNESFKTYDLYQYFFNADLRQNPFLEDNDVIFVPPAVGSVRIEGPVARTGLYELNNEKTVQDVIRLAGGLTRAASKQHPVKIVRFTESGDKMIMDVENDPKQLKKFSLNKGDIIVVPDILNNPENFDYSVETIPGENAFYPTSTPSVFVLGSVNQSGSYPYKSQLRVKDYISYASPLPSANLKSVQLIRGGKKRRLNFDEKPIPGDIVVVRDKIRTSVIVSTVSTAMSLVLTGLLLESSLKNRF